MAKRTFKSLAGEDGSDLARKVMQRDRSISALRGQIRRAKRERYSLAEISAMLDELLKWCPKSVINKSLTRLVQLRKEAKR